MLHRMSPHPSAFGIFPLQRRGKNLQTENLL
jgi:hypothetical protein